MDLAAALAGGPLIRRHLRRYGVASAALVAFTVWLLFSLSSIAHNQRSLLATSKENIFWTAAQAEVELLRLTRAVGEFGRASPTVTHETVQKRFDLFWSRVDMFRHGDVGQRLAQVAGVGATVEKALGILQAEESAFQRLRPGDQLETDRLLGRLAALHLPFRDIALQVMQGEEQRYGRIRAQLYDSYRTLALIVIGVVCSGAAFATLLLLGERRQRQLLARNRLFATAADAADTGIALTRLHKGSHVIEYANERLGQMLTTDAGALPGEDLALMLKQALSLDVSRAFSENAAQGRPISNREIRGRNKGGEVWFALSYIPVLNASGEPTSFYAEIEDVTARKHTEFATIAAKERAEAGSKSKAEFLATMSHEIRTPMNGILGMIQVLEEESLTTEQRKFLHIAKASGEHLLELLNDILDLSKLEAGSVLLEGRDFDVVGMIESVTRLFEPQRHQKDLRLTIDVAPDLIRRLRGDSARLRQILFNLIGNAFKFTPSGEIRIEAHTRPTRDGRVRLSMEISDTGIGIALEDQKNIFAPFSQVQAGLRSEHGGTGLGLSICKRLVSMMHGEIEVHSRPGEGSRFRFWATLEPAPHRPDEALGLPARDGAAELPLAVPTGTRVLLAEDSPTNQLFVKTVLEQLGVTVDVAVDGEQAVQAARNTVFDLILMDLRMPKINGIEATKAIRSTPGRERRPAIVAITAETLSEERSACMKAGMNAYLTKPIRRDDLMAALSQQLSSQAAPRSALNAEAHGSRGGHPPAAPTAGADAQPGRAPAQRRRRDSAARYRSRLNAGVAKTLRRTAW